MKKDSFRAHHLKKTDFSIRSIFHAEQAIIFTVLWKYRFV